MVAWFPSCRVKCFQAVFLQEYVIFMQHKSIQNIKFTVLPCAFSKSCVPRLRCISLCNLETKQPIASIFFTAALLQINVSTFSHSLIFIKCAIFWGVLLTKSHIYDTYLIKGIKKYVILASWLCKHCCIWTQASSIWS